MGFSLVGHLCSVVLMDKFHERNVKFPSLSVEDKFSINIRSSKLQLHKRGVSVCKSELVDFEERTSPEEIKKEVRLCYELINRLGRGVVYLGSSRMGPDHPHYSQALELAEEVAKLLDCTSWTGAGPGLMDAATKGALKAGKPVGGFMIAEEAGSHFHPYLPSETYLSCRFFSARKHGIVDAAVRNTESDRTGVVAFPGGVGTLDEMFELLGLLMMKRLGSNHPVPFLVMNYDSFYTKLFEFFDTCADWGVLSKGEIGPFWKVCNNNSEALAYLADFYALPFPGKDKHENNLTNVR